VFIEANQRINILLITKNDQDVNVVPVHVHYVCMHQMCDMSSIMR
jgi:hypothetical protein